MNRAFKLIFAAALVAGCGPGRIIDPTSGGTGSSAHVPGSSSTSSGGSTGAATSDSTASGSTTGSWGDTGSPGTSGAATSGDTATTGSTDETGSGSVDSGSTSNTGGGDAATTGESSTGWSDSASASTTGSSGGHHGQTSGATASSTTTTGGDSATTTGGGDTTTGGGATTASDGSTTTSGGSTTTAGGGTSTSGTSTTTSGSSTTTSGGGTTGTGGGGTVPMLGGCAMFPPDSVWNTDISQAPVSSRSSAWVSAIGSGTGVHPDFGTVWAGAPNGIPFVVVPISQPMIGVNFVEYPSESDPGPYPAPLDAPIEGGSNSSGDRHVLVLQQVSCTLYELYHAEPGTNSWNAGSGAIWHLSENEQRRDGETSADAAGLPMLPGLVRYDEVQTGEIRHALRFTAASIQSAYIYPATHSDGTAGSNANHPPMGARFRLRANFDVSGFPPEVQVILNALKRYGMILADTGGDWFVSGAPDPRWDDGDLATLSRVKGSDFEAIENGTVHPY